MPVKPEDLEFDDFYAEFITRRRWKLVDAVWLLHGIFRETTKEHGTYMELFYNDSAQERFWEAKETGRLDQDYIDTMLTYMYDETTTETRISNWEKLPSNWHDLPYDPETHELVDPDHEANRLEAGVRMFWHMLNTRGDLKYCEVPYVTKNGEGRWLALSPDAEWNAQYLLQFAKEIGMHVDWLVEAIQANSKNLKPYSLALNPLKKVRKMKRQRAYTPAVVRTMDAILSTGVTPTGALVLDYWKENSPIDISNVSDKGCKYMDKDGAWRSITSEKIDRTVKRYLKDI